MVSSSLTPANSRCPAIISHSTTPSEKMSERRLTSVPRTCSGDRYASLPSSLFSFSSSGRAIAAARAMPKSRIFTPPVHSNMMFYGVTSR